MSASEPAPAAASASASAPEPALNYTCNCECCREGFTDVCEQGGLIDLSNIHDFGAGPRGNKILEIILQRYKITETIPCPCNLPAEFDDFEFDFEMTEEKRAEVKEQFIKFYKDETGLEECEDDECEYPDGVEQDFTADYDYGQHMIDQQEAYYWAKGQGADVGPGYVHYPMERDSYW